MSDLRSAAPAGAMGGPAERPAAAGPRAARGVSLVLLLLIAVLLALPRLPLQLAGPDVQLSIMVDDASYYLEGARRSVESGAWPSMDGRHATNGFHPLYMGLLIGLQKVAGTEPRVVVPLVTLVNLVLNGLALGLLLRALLRRRAGGAALGAALVLALDPGWMVHGLLGVENSLSSLLLLLATLRWERRFGDDEAAAPRGSRAWLLDGVLLGLAMLARTDAALFAAAWLGGGLWRLRRRHGAAAAWGEMTAAGLVALLVVAPWLIVNLLRFGSLAQDSSAVLAARYARLYGPRLSAASLGVSALGLGFWAYRLLWSCGFVPLTGWLLGLAVPLEGPRRLRRADAVGWAVAGLCALCLLLRANDPTDIRDARMAALETGLGALAFLGGLLSVRRAAPRGRPVFGMAGAAAALTILAYVFGFRGFQVWYSTGICLVFALLVASSTLASALEGRRALTAALAALMLAQAGLVVTDLFRRGGQEGMHRRLLADGQELRARLERVTAGAAGPVRFGSFDSGELGYLVHPFPIANADGVMNHQASLAIRGDSLARYFEADRITHVLGLASRIAEFQRFNDFSAVPDPPMSAALGREAWRVGAAPRIDFPPPRP